VQKAEAQKRFANREAARHKKRVTKAFLLGAGLGTRLQPLTHRLPKPLVPFGAQPLIKHAWQACVALGCDDFAVNTHHLPQMWKDPLWGWSCADWQTLSEQGENGEFVEQGNLQGSSIRLFHEPLLLETGGGLRNIRAWMGDDTVLVHNGDIFSTMPLKKLEQAHRQTGLPVTLALRSQGSAKHIAYEEGRVIDIRNMLGKAEGTHVFSGIYCMNAELLDYLPAQNVVSVIPAFLRLAELGKLGCVVIDEGAWFDLGDRVSYLQAHQQMMLGDAIHPSAIIAKDAVIERSYIGAGVVVGAGAIIRDSVLWQLNHVENAAYLQSCIGYSGNPITGTHHDADL
jgi:NDP-sugar pyrophosphorylase family protein